MKKINSIEEFHNSIHRDEYSMIYFYTDWCPDCFATKMFIPMLENEYKKIHFFSVNRDEFIEIAKHYNIFGIPSFLMFKNEEVVGELVSGKRKSYIEVKQFIDDLFRV